jgi:hypothetical protein
LHMSRYLFCDRIATSCLYPGLHLSGRPLMSGMENLLEFCG